MKWILSTILLMVCSSAFSGTAVTHIQTWATGTNGARLSDSVMSAGSLGSGGSWSYAGEDHGYIIVRTNLPKAIPITLSLGGVDYNFTSTNYLNWQSNGICGTCYDNAVFTFTPGFSNLVIMTVIRSTATNNDINTLCNYDWFPMYVDTGGYAVFQHLVRSGQSYFRMHCDLIGGESIIYRDDHNYFLMIEYNMATWLARARMYDIDDSYSQATNDIGGTGSLGTFTGNQTLLNFKVQANYLNASTVTGSNWISTIFLMMGGNDLVAPPLTMFNSIMQASPSGRRGFQ